MSEEVTPLRGKKRECPEIVVSCRDIRIPALIDTGSEISAIDEEFFERLLAENPRLPVFPMKKCYIVGATKGKSRPITKQAMVDITIGTREVEVVCLVVKNLIREVILGADWLTEVGAVIDFDSMKVRLFARKKDQISKSFPLINVETNVEKRVGSIATRGEIEDTISGLTHLSAEEQSSLSSLLVKHQEVFSEKPGLAKGFVHRIRLSEEKPFALKSYPIPHVYESQVDLQIEDMLKNGIIRKAPSPYVNPIVIVKKADGRVRLCIDARKLNSLTIPEHDEPPRIDELLRKFYGKKFFSTTDFTSAYWQMKLHPSDQKYTAFLYKSISYVFQRVPYGLKNSGAAMVRCLDNIIGPDAASFVTVYVDDLLVASDTFDSHLEQLEILFKRFKDANVTLNFLKSRFCRLQVPFVGYIITPQGVIADEEKISAVQRAPPPRNVKQLRSFLGLCNYYARFCEGYAHLIVPLLPLLKKGESWKWTRVHQNAFEEIKSKFLYTVMLHYPDFLRPMYLQTDSSDYGLGAVLFQRDEAGHDQVVAFISRTLKGSELAYTTTEKEALAVVWALQKLRTIILGSELTIFTDHKALTFLTKCNLNNSRLTRWVLAIQGYSFKIEHCPGKRNIVPDWLSRTFPDGPLNDSKGNGNFIMAVVNIEVAEFPEEMLKNLSQFQQRDNYLGKLYRYLTHSMPSTEPDFRKLERVARNTRLVRNIIHKVMSRTNNHLKIWVPEVICRKLVWYAHTKHGHCGASKVLGWLKEKYFWVKMGRFVRALVKTCDLCQRTKYPNRNFEGPMVNIIPVSPRDLYAVDIYGPLPKGRKRNKYLFVVIDVFSKYVQAYPMTKPTSKNCLRALLNAYFPLCGKPKRVLSDHGSQFTSRQWKDQLSELEIQVIYSSVRRPQTNPSERVMRELSRVFRTYCSENHGSWVELTPWINKWFNEIVHESTGLTPMEVHFGRKPPREDDNIVEISDRTGRSLEEVTRLVLGRLDEAGRKRKSRQKGKTHSFRVNDQVLLRTPRPSDARANLFHKFFHLYTGPFRITKMSGPNACHLEDKSRRHIGIYNFGNLRPYFKSPTEG